MKLWGGRFSKDESRLTEDFNASIGFDQKMYQQDIRGSIAHATMLARQHIITEQEKDQIVAALQAIEQDITAGRLTFTVEAEDVHMNIETFLIERIGETGKKLHTARSRNDQVALDIRLYVRDELKVVDQMLIDLLEVLLYLAAKHTETVMPGYTHLQKAQPVTLAHHLLAYVEMFGRDRWRLADAGKRVNYMPLGSGALAGTGFNLDRHYVADQLGFDHITANSLDGVSDRDFVIEITAAASILMMHFSRLCEELILWSSEEFGFIEMDDAFSTGSSIMPQKKNPDIAELVRGKTGRVYGHLMGLLTMMKGLPLAYNKDMQEDKEALFDTLDTVKKCLLVVPPMLESMRVNSGRMAKGAEGGFTNATDFADYLVAKGIAFREAHRIVGEAVLYCIREQKSLLALSVEELAGFSPLVDEDIYEYLSILACVRRRSLPGGPAPSAVEKAIAQARKEWLKEDLS
ncbi:MAG: argininosuccinate lyase [Methylocystaceae bacterium]